MKNKTQIFYIHGGNTFRKHQDYLHYLKTRKIALRKIRWYQGYLDRELSKNFQVIRPRMPLQDNAKYSEWKICFESYFPYLKNNIILMGGSLGGIFLAKYLSENKFPKKILATYLICPPFENTLISVEEELSGGFNLKSNLSLIEINSPKLYLMFSKDDDIVPIAHAEKYRTKLKRAKIIIYKSKNGHFGIEKFPEIVKMVKQNRKSI